MKVFFPMSSQPSMVVSETGYESKKNEISTRGLLDGLPIRGGERVDIELTD